MTNRIHVLPPAVAERIAAGEVIERPASVVKELVENSIDAGATEIVVVLEDGGKQLIEITDNGCGMSPDDLRISVQRHATSKLSSLEELEKIITLGFRGEALPSVAAVSDLTILSRGQNQDTTYELRAAAPGMARSEDDLKKVTFGHFLNSPHGTRIQARGLFSQVPARLKFLKSQASEVGHVREWIERVALAHPQIGFKLVSNDRTVLSLRPEEATARVGALLSEGDTYPLVQAESEGGGFKIRIYWFQGLSLPSSRKLLQVINGRSVRDRLIQQATMSAFRQSLLPGQFPAVAVFIQIDPSLLDVNVHPTKTEVRFLNSRDIFRSISSLIEASLVKHGAPTYAGTRIGSDSNSASGAFTPFQAAFQASSNGQSYGGNGSQQSYSPSQTSDSANWAQASESHQLPTSTTPSLWNLAEVQESLHPLSHSTYVGTLFGTYFVFDDKTEMVLVDQHAAHERIRYEKLKARVTGPLSSLDAPMASTTSQALLIPESVRFPEEQRALVESRLSLLTDLGFDLEVFGENMLLVRGVPTEWGSQELGIRLKNLVERLIALETEGSRELLWDETLFEKLASEACHSAIRAGDRVDSFQSNDLVRQLFQCQHPWNCPHGRPTVVRIPRGKLEEWFQRRV
jgi:DNA mismatch repair protein MutL